MVTRRQFNIGLASLAFSGVFAHFNVLGATPSRVAMALDKAYGPLIPDPNGILDLPAGFSYRVISKLGDMMSDGLPVPDRADGMGCIAIDDERVVLVRNHEIAPSKAFAEELNHLQPFKDKAYDSVNGQYPLAGGTSNIVYNTKTGQIEDQFMSLLGTIRNCAGGTTPWGSWLTCEENVATASEHLGQDHGFVFEVPAAASGLVDPVPLKEMGRFNHEATCIDPSTGIVYLTEDRSDSLFYRFIPNVPGELDKGGVLQALAVRGQAQFDTRNWSDASMTLHQEYDSEWITLDDVYSKSDDLRERGHAKGAALFARGEGIHFDNGEMYFCCTSGGVKQLGQIMRYVPSKAEGTPAEKDAPGQVSLFLESPDKSTFNYGDNIIIAPNDHLIVCEDQYSEEVNNHLKGVTKDGQTYDLAAVRWQTEPAGVCFSPDGSTLFVNLYSPTATLAIQGPWEQFKA